MQTMYNNTKKSRLTNTTKENNYYYEPTIKTTRNNISEEELERLNKDFYRYNMKDINEDLGRYITQYSNLLREKQQLIDFLEDKIKECDNIIYKSNYDGVIKNTIITKSACQEVLDFVNKGGKDD